MDTLNAFKAVAWSNYNPMKFADQVKLRTRYFGVKKCLKDEPCTPVLSRQKTFFPTKNDYCDKHGQYCIKTFRIQ